ncbi:MAG: hypothetical protein JWP06_641 [Candidatus Saccharibacteria bacterium]|nr:hypothetical protein [Candidatus Saccharibacteria bacterium]
MLLNISEAKIPIVIVPRNELDASHLLFRHGSHHTSKPVGEVEIKPCDQVHVSLGNFDKTNMPKGYSVQITPRLEPDAIVTQITSLETDEECELVLHVANYGDKTVSAEVWQRW